MSLCVLSPSPPTQLPAHVRYPQRARAKSSNLIFHRPTLVKFIATILNYNPTRIGTIHNYNPTRSSSPRTVPDAEADGSTKTSPRWSGVDVGGLVCWG
ncbi:hypothetical protein QJS10_CPA07g00613 [Acorus calamus]|uniref:Uncharacterized protein n=1 Tax=Acorus calamus TaxID=4465 RepID=A0AAV9EGW2_ACOCL|nr:hypothetical protein QJS10_CPA07g00613 [Acorus calamus]